MRYGFVAVVVFTGGMATLIGHTPAEDDTKNDESRNRRR
jgi:hypothetical protein